MKHKRLLLTAIALLVICAGLVTYFYHGTASTPAAASSRTSPSAHTPSASPSAVTDTFNASAHSITDPTSIWVIVNKRRPLNPRNYAPSDLVSVGNNQVMRREAAAALTTMFSAARAAGYTLTAASAYRSYDTQVSVYNKEVADYGQARADSESARPGYSEHQTGLAVDIAGGGCSITDCFGTTAEGKWATANAYKYGYILRYTPSNTAITGYRAEAWHFRYVGNDLSVEMHTRGVSTFEEFFSTGAAPDYN